MPRKKGEVVETEELEKETEKAGFEALGVFTINPVTGRKQMIREYAVSSLYTAKDVQWQAESYAKKRGGTVEKTR